MVRVHGGPPTVLIRQAESRYPQRVSDPLLPLGRDMWSRDLFLIPLLSWDDWPRDLELPSRHFCLLSVGDAQGTAQEVIDNFIDGALDAGCVYSCAWGPDCARVELSFDLRWVQRNIEDINSGAPVLMTTSHERDTLEDALEFLTVVAVPDDAFVATCGTALVAVVGNDEWVTAIRHQFGN